MMGDAVSTSCLHLFDRTPYTYREAFRASEEIATMNFPAARRIARDAIGELEIPVTEGVAPEEG